MRMKMTSRMMMRMMVTMVKMTRFKFVARAEPERRQRVQPVYRPSAFPEARSGAIIIIILFINIISRMMINITQSDVVNTEYYQPGRQWSRWRASPSRTSPT